MSTVDLTDMELMSTTSPAPAAPVIEDVVTDPPGGWGCQSLLIRQIRRDGGTQARVGNNETTVQDYTELMRDQLWDFQSRQRPIVLYDGSDFWLADGFHRIEAAQRAGLTDYPVEVLRGTQRDAVLRAAGANSQHGLRRTNEDKRRAVELILKDEEWRQWSDRKIADVCAVSNKFVGDVRRDLSVFGTQMPETRTVERSGTTYQMTPAAPKEAPTPPADITDEERQIAAMAGHIWESSDLIPGKQAVYHFRNTGGVIDGTIMTRPQFDAWLKIHTPIIRTPISDMPPPDLSAYGYTARWLPDGRIAIRAPGNLETEHTAGALNDLLQYWRSYPPIPTDLAAMGVAWCYRSDRMYQVENNGTPHHTGYTAEACLAEHRAYLERTGQLATPPAEPDDQALLAQIREKTEGYGLQLILEDGKALVYWEGEDVELMELQPYALILEWLEYQAEGAWERYKAEMGIEAAPTTPTIADLDALLPKELFKAGYFWTSATPPTIAHNMGNWRGEAPTPEQALQLAYARERAKTVLTVTIDLATEEEFTSFPGLPTDMAKLQESIDRILRLSAGLGPGPQRQIAPAMAVLRAARRAIEEVKA